jgi:hypothetical protein
VSELPTLDPDTDPALAAAVLEIESHVAEGGWDQPSRLYALVDTAALVRREPALASAMGLDDASAAGSLTPVEQEQLPADRFEAELASLAWGPEVAGCAVVVERLVLPPEADEGMPDDPAAAAAYALEHPERQEVRMVVGVTRDGASYCALRLRAHDEDHSVVGGTDLVPELITVLAATLDPVEDPEIDDPEIDDTEIDDTEDTP